MTREINAPVSVIEPVGKALDEVKAILFRPFSLEKWFTIGFCAWLAYLGSSGGGPGGGGNKFQGPGNSPLNQLEHAKEWFISNMVWVIPLACAFIGVFILIGLVFSWLRSRGQFMFLYCVAKNKAEVVIPWTKYSRHGNSLFLFQIAFGLISLVIVALYVLIVGLCIFLLAGGISGTREFGVPMILGIIAGVIGLIMLVILLAVIKKFTLDFVVPIMYLRTPSCVAAWREFIEILSARKGALCVYILFHFVIGITISAIILAFALITCCCACCFMAIPYIWAVLLLPILVFKRAYSLHYLRQFGSDFDVFVPDEEIVAPISLM